jgi:hypothetical protein
MVNLEIPVRLLTSWIIRRMAIVYGNNGDLTQARVLADELTEIIDEYLALAAETPPDSPSDALLDNLNYHGHDEDFVRTDFIFALIRCALDWWPQDDDTTASESVWVMEQFMHVGGDDLYKRWLRLTDKINNTDIADYLEMGMGDV